MKIYTGSAFSQAQLERRQILLPPSLRWLRGRSLLFMTDLHVSASFPLSALARLVDQANALKPDLILLGGDLAETAEDQLAALPYLASLKAPLGRYTVLGNNDYHHMTINGRPIHECLRDAGVETLVDQQAILPLPGGRIMLAGLDVYNPALNKAAARKPERFFEQSTDADFRIALAHYPQTIPLRLSEFVQPPHLALSGHTHGGQFRLGRLTPFSIGFEHRRKADLMPPSGWTEQYGFPALVSNGIGTSRLPFRLNVPPQIHLITLE